MTEFFTAEFFSSNRKSLQDKTNARLIVFAANGLLQRSADTTYAFRQDSNFWYLTGIEEPDFVLVLSSDETFLIAPKRDDHRDQWDGAINKDELQRVSGIETIYEHHEGWTKLDMLLKKHKKAHTITPAEPYFEHFGFYANPARATLLNHLDKHKKLETVDIRKQIAQLRQIKQQPEIAALKQAISITNKTLQKVQKNLQKYTSEHQIEADITREFIYRGASGHAYQPIVAAGKNAAVIHYVKNNQEIQTGDLILLDVGAEVSNYSADITRTYAVGRQSSRQKDVTDAVVRVQKQALKLLGPGVDMKKYEKQIDAIMAKELKKLKLVSNTDDKKQLKKYYPHLASHFLGLDTHDAADYTTPLQPGMVLTVEPGIYIPEEGIGVRIEDDILITETGNEVLSADLPQDLA